MDPNLNTYWISNRIERQRFNSRPALLATRRISTKLVIEHRGDTARHARLGGAMVSLLGRVQGALPLRRSPAVPRLRGAIDRRS